MSPDRPDPDGPTGRPLRFRRTKTALLLLGFAGGLAVGLGGLQRSSTPPPLVTPPPGPPALGIDTSSYQHPGDARIGWLAVRGAGISYVYMKATEGATLVDPWFATDWAGVARAGLYRGAYHYARPAPGSAVADADAFLHVVGPLDDPEDLPPALDLEDAGGLDPPTLTQWVTDWLAEVARHTGRRPVVYTRAAFWTASMADTTQFASAPLWVARYTTDPDPGPLFGGWVTWTLWQWSSTGRVPGVPAAVDQNRLAGGGPGLAALAAQRDTSPP